ncbi:transcription initiation factor TFIID subunit 4-like isoform X2 [Betta splendens]|nr:transcription initiation factor TFIID subunit 4-like isoform X2 [Betta splendens]
MDGATSASKTAAQAESDPGTVTGVVTDTRNPHAAAAQTLNGSAAVMSCHIPAGASADGGGDSSQSAVTLVNNGPVSESRGSSPACSTIVRTSTTGDGSHVKADTSPQPSAQSVPTVTLVRPPMQTLISNKSDSTKAVTQTCNAQVASVVPTGIAPSTKSPAVLHNLRTSVPSTLAATPAAGIRAAAPPALAPRITQPQQNVQNIQLPPGMVLIRSESGQLLMIHQQTLAQMQAQSQSQSAVTPRPAAPTSTPAVQLTSLQASGTSILTRSVTPTTIIKQGSTVQTTVTPTTTLQRPPVLQKTIVLGGSATTSGQPLGTPTVVQAGSAATAVTQRETLENVKKCKNFLSTLIKLASSGKQSSETTANVKKLVKNLLEGKIEPEDFTSSLYRELSSSPQPYLVPFLNRSLPALRQMTPDAEAFIQQSLGPQASSQPAAAASTALTAVVLRRPLSAATFTTAATGTAVTKTTVISLPQTSQTKPGVQVAPQQQGMMVRPQVTLAQSSMLTFRGQPHSHIIVTQPKAVKHLQSVPAVKQTLVPGAKGLQVISHISVAAQKNTLNEAGGGSYRDDDDINDVASMAGVNLCEENARILATSSEFVGRVTRSCKDETFLSTSLLTRRALEIGKKFGVSEMGTDVINYISHAAQQRLQTLLEKTSQVAQQKNRTFKEDERHVQVSDVRTQLKFFEQLDQVEKQRKEEQEREVLLKAAKSRSRQEDPEQLRLKQKAKEMQQQELAQIRHREANQTALAAIGPRKKRRMDSPVRGSGAEGSGSGSSHPGGPGSGSRHFMRQRITRVNLRDLLFCLENEKGASHSHLLYKGFLK